MVGEVWRADCRWVREICLSLKPHLNPEPWETHDCKSFGFFLLQLQSQALIYDLSEGCSAF